MKEFSEMCFQIANKKGLSLSLPLPQPILEASAFMMQVYTNLVSRKAPIMTYESAKASDLGLAADCSRAVKELGYQCRPLQVSLKDATEWFKENGYI